MDFRFVLDQRLQLMECPTVKAASHFLARSNPFADMSQLFHNDRSRLSVYCLLNDLFAHYVVGMLDTARFLARDFLQKLFCRCRTVGLQAAPFRQKFMSFMADFSSAISSPSSTGEAV